MCIYDSNVSNDVKISSKSFDFNALIRFINLSAPASEIFEQERRIKFARVLFTLGFVNPCNFLPTFPERLIHLPVFILYILVSSSSHFLFLSSSFFNGFFDFRRIGWFGFAGCISDCKETDTLFFICCKTFLIEFLR